jgi:hypothetical protein
VRDGESDRVSVGIAHVRHPFAPRHVGGLGEDRRALRPERLDDGLDLIHVDEQLEPDSFTHRSAVLLLWPFRGDDRELVVSATQTDVARLALGRKLKVRLEAEQLVERGRLGDA